MKHNILINYTKLTLKPIDDAEVGTLVNGFQSKQVSIKELKNHIKDGCTFTPANYKNCKNRNANYISQTLIGYDFDNKDNIKITPKECLERLSNYKLSPCIIYSTFNSDAKLQNLESCDRFRILFQLENEIYNFDKVEEIYNVFRKLLSNQIDKQAIKKSQFFFGAKNILYFDAEAYLSLENLKWSIIDYDCESTPSINNISSKLKTNDRKYTFAQEERLYLDDLDWGTVQDTDNNDKSKFSHKIDSVNTLEHLDIDKEELLQVLQNLQIFKDFKSRKLSDWELYCLVTNLYLIDNGCDIYKEYLKTWNYNFEEKIRKTIYVKSNKDFPKNFSNELNKEFSPCDMVHTKSIYTYVKEYIDKKTFEVLDTPKTIDIDTARTELNEHFHTAMSSNDCSVHVIKTSTGVGKTHQLAEILKCLNASVIIGFPTHDLKNEFSERLIANGTEHISTPSDNELPDDIQNERKFYFQIGVYDKASQLTEVRSNETEVKSYLQKRDKCQNYEGIVLSTHDNIILNHEKYKANLIIFDEDIVDTFLKTSSASFTELKKLKEITKNDKLSNLIKEIEDIVDKDKEVDINIQELLNFTENEIENIKSIVIDNKLETNILTLLKCPFAVWVTLIKEKIQINFIEKRFLPDYKKVIILSATANNEVYHKIFCNRLHFYESQMVEPVGQIYQFRKISCSKSSLENENTLKKVIEKVKTIENYTSIPAITFYNQKDALKKEQILVIDELHYFNCKGSDSYKGNDLLIIGTPHPNPSQIALYAKSLEIKFKRTDFNQSNYKSQVICYKNHKFRFKTFVNEELRRLHLYLIETQIQQAIGRARANIYDCNVYLFSNFPVDCAIQME